jgi:hypothetical protein
VTYLVAAGPQEIGATFLSRRSFAALLRRAPSPRWRGDYCRRPAPLPPSTSSIAPERTRRPARRGTRPRIDALADALHRAPKGRKWKLRARVGERVKWYEEPEEARD